MFEESCGSFVSLCCGISYGECQFGKSLVGGDKTAICLKFAENGADIAFLYAGNTVKAEETVKELEGLGVKAKASASTSAEP